MKKELQKILVVDDEPDVCEVLKESLQSSGYFCRSETSPARALGKLKRDGFQLLISDIRMADIDGLQLLKRMLEIDPDLDAIMMTGHTDIYSYSDIIAAGASDFITKPFEQSELIAKVERVRRERKMHIDLQEANIALGVLLQQASKEKEALRENVVFNMKELLSPSIEKLKNGNLNSEHKKSVEVLETTVAQIFSEFAKNLSHKHAHVSSMEVQVANLIKIGKSNKDIASILGVSMNTVMTHRFHLRTKLGIKQKRVNLKQYLNSIEF